MSSDLVLASREVMDHGMIPSARFRRHSAPLSLDLAAAEGSGLLRPMAGVAVTLYACWSRPTAFP